MAYIDTTGPGRYSSRPSDTARLPLLQVNGGRSQAEVAELVDALASGASWGNPVEVQVLSSAPSLQLNIRIGNKRNLTR